MKKEEFTLKSKHDDLELGVSLRIPEQPTGILQLVHGMAEHRERYHDFMNFCAEQGLVVIIHDHRGHGASVKSPEDYGYFYENGLEGIIEDVYQVTKYVRERFPDLPLTLFGHSMGSLVVRCYIKKYDAEIDGLVVCGSPSKRLGSGVGLQVAKILKHIQGEHYRSQFVNDLSFGGYTKKFPGEKSINSWIVSDPAVVEAYDADERDGFVFTLNGFEVLFGLMQQAYSKKGWAMNNPGMPILFIAGAEDPCIIDEKHFQEAVNFLRERGYNNVLSKLYPGMRHEILNEVGKQQVWQDVVAQTRRAEKRSGLRG